MFMMRSSRRYRPGAALTIMVLYAPLCCAQALAQPAGRPPTPAPAASARPSALGLDLFGAATLAWPAAKESFEAASLGETTFEFGGGGRVTGIWRALFAQAAVSRWSETGERAFVDDEGNVFPLGIGLDVEATYFDATIGWKTPMRRRNGTISALPYLGAGAGVVKYSEASPFAQANDDVEETGVTYNILAGVEVPLFRRVAMDVQGRYRIVPDILGSDGVSLALGEDSLGAFGLLFGIRVGFGGPPQRVVPPPVAPTRDPADQPRVAPGSAPAVGIAVGVIIADAPVYLKPDATRTPLRTLTVGTNVMIMEETAEWYQVQFSDPQFGPRVGYVLRKFVRVGKS